jgi:DNA-binding response OmpR family regulator
MSTESISRILVVDDDVHILHNVKRMLERQGHLVLVHDGGPGCLNMAQCFEPDLVLVDVKMPFLSGDALVSLFGKHVGASRPAVVLYSGMDEHTLQKMAKTCGADGYISKSESAPILVQKVAGFIRARGTTNPLPEPVRPH